MPNFNHPERMGENASNEIWINPNLISFVKDDHGFRFLKMGFTFYVLHNRVFLELFSSSR